MSEKKDGMQETISSLVNNFLDKSEKQDGIRKSTMVATDIPMSGVQQDAISTILTALKKTQDIVSVQKLSFDVDPTKEKNFGSIYRKRNNVIPPDILKRLRDTEEMIGGVILPIRARQLAMFARPRANRFDIGFAINIKPEVYATAEESKIKQIKEEIVPKLRELLINCGRTEGIKDKDKRSLAQFLMESVEDGLLFGSFAVEVRKDRAGRFHSFKAVDAGTIYQVQPQKGDSKEAENIRRTAKTILEQLDGNSIDVTKFNNDDYTWVQVIDNVPKQVYTDEEMLVFNINPSTDIQRNGYPVSPVERVISAITTHINLTTHNKMYFVNGKAARNVMIFKSDNLEPQDIETIKMQMQAHINSSNAAWRMPVFGIGAQDDVSVMPMDTAGRDMEFQYLADLNKRILFAAYQMSPDEVAALSYLSRGTNSQAMSESSNEYKLLAARDSGLRPLLMAYEDFFNERLLPKINKEWSHLVRIDFEGIDSESPEKESTRIQQDSALYLTMNSILDRVEEDHVKIGGEFPLNPIYMQVLEKYYTKGQILKVFGGEEFKDADKDPNMNYCMNDPTSVQTFMQKNQMEMQAKMQQQQLQQGQSPNGQPQEGQNEAPAESQEDMDSAIDQLSQSLTKSEKSMPTNRRELHKKFKKAKTKILKEFEQDSKEAMDLILKSLEKSEDNKGE